jgi:hypothetical protein
MGGFISLGVDIVAHNKTKDCHYFANKRKIPPFFSTSTKPSNEKQEHDYHKNKKNKPLLLLSCLCCNKT